MNKPCISAMFLKIKPRQQALRSIKTQSGSALMIAIFVIIVISLLGASLMSLQRDSAEGTSYEIYAARAYFAAYSASEIALVKQAPLNTSDVTPRCEELAT